MEKEQRNRLQKATQDARKLLEEEFRSQLLQTYDIDVERVRWAEEPGVHLQAEQRLIREKLVAWIEHKEAQINDRKEALLLALREMAFTALNRFVALKLMEARELVRPCVSGGLESAGFLEFTAVAQGLLADQESSYRLYLETIFEDVSRELRALFDPRDPASLLWPKRAGLLELLDTLNRPELSELWSEDETLGWVYQYFNGDAERKKMREESSAPRNSRELAVRNQFFTPRYVVEFLTDNTLGRIWYEMRQGNTGLKDRCRYLVRRPNEVWLQPGGEPPAQPDANEALSQEELLLQPVYIPHRPLKDPREIRMLDPACGSMHFGLYAFDLYLAIYEEAWEIAQGSDEQAKQGEAFTAFVAYVAGFADKAAFLREVPRLILLHNINGIDIDPRATQIARLTLWLRAQRAWHKQQLKVAQRPPITRSNVVCAEPMPGERELLADFVDQQFPEAERGLVQQLLEAIFDKMELAGEAGSLLLIEEEIREAITQAQREWKKLAVQQQSLFSTSELAELGQVGASLANDLQNLTKDFWVGIEERLYDALRNYAEDLGEFNALQRKLFAEDAAQGFAYIDVCRRFYDAILMNPPFGAMSKASCAYTKAKYSRWRHDIYPCFISLGSNLLARGGLLGYLAPRTGYFSQRLNNWRREILLGTTKLSLLSDLGLGVLDGALVEVAAGVIMKDGGSDVLINFDCLPDHSSRKGDGLLRLVQTLQSDQLNSCSRIFAADHNVFLAVPGFKLLFGAPKKLLSLYSESSLLDPAHATVREGPYTADNERFIRLWWEVPACRNARRHWPFYAKGGAYAPYYSNPHLVIDWRHEGKDMILGEHSVLPSQELYFEPGITYTERTASSFNARVLPRGCIFSQAGPIIRPNRSSDGLALLGYLMSLPSRALLELLVGSGDGAESVGAARHFLAGTLSAAPIPPLSQESLTEISFLTHKAIQNSLGSASSDETDISFRLTENHFQKPSLGSAYELRNHLERVLSTLESTWNIQNIIVSELELGIPDLNRCGDLVSPHPWSLPRSSDGALGDLILDYECLSEEKVVDKAAEMLPGRIGTKQSFQADRRIELACLASGIHPIDVAAAWPEPGSHRLEDFSSRLISLAMGIALGRWKAVVDEHDDDFQSSDPWAPLPDYSPSQIVPHIGAADISARNDGDASSGSRPSGILACENSFLTLSAANTVRQALSDKLFVNTLCAIEEALTHLDAASLEAYLAQPSGFFAYHLALYSRSRRQAPIYWQLASGSGSYSAWLYYHSFTKDTLYRVLRDFVEPRIQQAEREQFELESQGALSGDAATRLQEAQTLLQDLRIFKSELDLVAPLWNPNLNDGVIINHAILWRITPYIPWQKKCKECWDKLVKGDYDWAHLAFHLWPERVIPKCVTDRSLAIAHGLNGRLWQETNNGNWLPRQLSEVDLQALIAERSNPAVKSALERFLAAPPPVAPTRTRASRSTRSSGSSTPRRARGSAAVVDAEATRQVLLALTAAPSDGLAKTQIADLIGVEANALTAVIKQLKESGQIDQLGERRGARYVLNEQGRARLKQEEES